MKNSPDVIALYLAAMQAGFYFVPINVRLAPREILHILRDSQAAVLVADDPLEAPGVQVFASCEPLLRDMPTTTPEDRTLGETMFYTSGTTGTPRGVRRPLTAAPPDRACAKIAVMRLRGIGISASTAATHLVVSPLYHSAALAWCTAHVHAGHPVVVINEWSPEGVLERIARHHITSSFMVPTHFVRLLALPDRARYDVSSLRHIVHGGAACRVDIKQRMMEWWGPIIHEVYGAAEALGGTYVGPRDWLAHPGTVGMGRGVVRVLREDGTACDPGEVGTIVFEARAGSFEYLHDDDKTAAAQRGSGFTVGDLGYLDPDGFLFLTGRSSDVIISGGVNIYPAEIEAVLATHPNVVDVAVFGIPDDDWGEQIKAVVQTTAPTSADELSAFCRERLAGFKCPRTIDFVAELPRDANGKMYKRLLRDPYWSS
jgi:long-chain acyl-CoA synthetase